MEVKVNNKDLDKVHYFLQDEHGEIYIASDSITQLNLKTSSTAATVTVNDKEYYSLAMYPGLKYKFIPHKMAIHFTIPTALQNLNVVQAYNENKLVPNKIQTGGFANYDVNWQKIDNANQVSALTEEVLYTNNGVGITNQLLNIAGGERKWIRLSTTWIKDNADKMTTTRYGDSFIAPGSWGQIVGFGGFQWATNFATQPYFIPYPLSKMQGVASIPSTVDLYVNNALVSKTNIPAGPFSITNIPTLNGQGVANVVINDLLGREQIINLPFYGSNILLKKGLHDDSISVGLVRNNYGIQSNNYKNLFITGTNRYGVNDTLTHETRYELLAKNQTLGFAETLLLNKYGIVTLATALSHSKRGIGKLGLLSYQFQNINSASYGINLQLASLSFKRLGLDDEAYLPTYQTQTYIGFPFKTYNISLSYTLQNNYKSTNASFLTCSISKSLPYKVSANLVAMRSFGKIKNNSIFFTLTKSFGERETASTTYMDQPPNRQYQINVQRSLPTNTGWGYNANLGFGQADSYQLSMLGQTRKGNYTATIARQANKNGLQLDANGSIAYINKQVYFSRMIADSFAVVDVPGYQDITIYLNNQPISRTGPNGIMLIPQLVSYNKNLIQLHANKLPLSASFAKDTLVAIPPYRSGLILTFPVYESHDVLLKIKTLRGENIPAGAQVKLNSNQRHFFVGNDGDAYLSELQNRNHIVVAWLDKQCSFDLLYQPTKDPLPDLGSFICKGNT